MFQNEVTTTHEKRNSFSAKKIKNIGRDYIRARVTLNVCNQQTPSSPRTKHIPATDLTIRGMFINLEKMCTQLDISITHNRYNY